jgi:lysophospholipase L1-like esterase
MVFPYHLQLAERDYLGPQRILAKHAAEHGVEVLDLAGPLRRVVFGEELAERILAGDVDARALRAEYQTELYRYYLDSNHFTPDGNRIIAAELYEWIQARGSRS